MAPAHGSAFTNPILNALSPESCLIMSGNQNMMPYAPDNRQNHSNAEAQTIG
jgi:hypothetical protein